MLGVVVSRADEASVHIGERLRAVADWSVSEDATCADAHGGGAVYRLPGAELREFDGLHVELDGAAEPFDDPDLLVFASRHSGETGPLLTTHHTGNVGPAEFGGAPDELAAAAPGALAAAVDALAAHAPDGYDVGLEATHHGPTDVAVPSLFVEVGSVAAQWRDPAAATAAARTALALRDVDPRPDRAFVGFGGGHYAPRFTRIVRETDWAVGHIASDWGLDAIGTPAPEFVDQVFERSGARLAVIDGERPRIAALVDELGYRLVGEAELRETSGVPLPLVEQLEGRLGAVDDGLRFGQLARGDDPPRSFDVVSPSSALLADASAVDAERARAAVDAVSVAYETAESGSRVDGRVAVRDAAAWTRIESSLVDLLRERFEEVVVGDDRIVATEVVFDPDRARALGVEPGPAFGRLAAGESVTVEGREVAPEAVQDTRTRRYRR